MLSAAKIKAFTLIEMIVVMAILSVLLGIGVPLTVNYIRNYSLQSDRDTVLALLEWARSQALANHVQSGHGVKITATQYIGFVGATYANRNPAFDMVYPKSSTLTASGSSEVDFAPLSARTTSATITLSNGSQQKTLTINPEGTINW